MNVIKNEWFVTPVWEVQTDFDTEFNNNLLSDISQYSLTNPNEYNLWQSSGKYINELKEYTKQIVKELTYEYVDRKSTRLNSSHT